MKILLIKRQKQKKIGYIKKKLKLIGKKADKEEIKLEVEKLTKDAEERKKKKEKPARKLKEIYDLDNIASESSKLLILENFLKNFELSLLNLFKVKDNYNVNFEEYCNMLYTLGFVKFDQNSHKELLVKKHKEEEESKKKEENKVNSPIKKVDNPLVIDNNAKRGKSEKPEERALKKVDKEYKIISESWKVLAKDHKKINTNLILVFFNRYPWII